MPFQLKTSIKDIFAGGASKLVDSVGKVLDNVITTKEELEVAKQKANEEINRHLEELQNKANDIEKAYLADTQNARTRETDFVKATGHMDYIIWLLVIISMAIFSFMVYSVIKGTVPTENRELIFHIFGIVEGFILSIFSYYFGSSAGSRIKDMKAKQN